MRGLVAAIGLASALGLAAPALAQTGNLVAAVPMTETPAGTQAWKIRYLTRDERGVSREVTGIVIAPREAIPARGRPVIAWTHGAWGTAEKCAPSLSPRFFETTAAVDAARKGYVVTAPDYIGLGSPGPHPFLVGGLTGRTVLDSVRAARQIPRAAAGTRFAVWGESQGGHAALWTGRMASTEGRGLELVGVAAGAPPTDLAANFSAASDPNARAYLTSLAVNSWNRYYGAPINFGKKRTPGLMARLAAGCTDTLIKPNFGSILGIIGIRQDLRGVDLARLRPWASHLAANSTVAQSRVPILLAQAVGDPLVSANVTRQFGRKLCANRVRVRWIDIPGRNHVTTAKDSAAATIEWIGQRFAGVQAPNDCGQF